MKSHSDQKKSGKLSGSMYNVRLHGTYCLKCNKDFKDPLKLKKHYQKVHDKDRRICDTCGKSFTLKYTLATHIDIEHHGKRFKCPLKDCGEEFKRKDQLQILEMKHKGEAKFICSVCQQHFFHRNHFENHMNLHEGIRNYSCPKCVAMFLYNQDCYRHSDSCGVKDKLYKCQVGECQSKDKGFTMEMGLAQHMKSYHHMGDMLMCSVCAYTTHDQNNYRQHML